jgi:Protein of unknown function (DUF3309)
VYIILIVILVLLLLGVFPSAPWGSWHGLGYYPSTIVVVLLIILAVLLLTGRL